MGTAKVIDISKIDAGAVTQIDPETPITLGGKEFNLVFNFKAIKQIHKEYSVNIPTVDMVEVTDYTGLVSGKRVDKSKLFEVFYGELKAAPMIIRCPITMECRVVEVVSLPTNSFFIGEIVGIFSEERFLTEGKPDVKKVNPFLLTMPDNRFWSIGECVGNAWNAGSVLRDQQKQKQE